jgi:hypothetical protein
MQCAAAGVKNVSVKCVQKTIYFVSLPRVAAVGSNQGQIR